MGLNGLHPLDGGYDLGGGAVSGDGVGQLGVGIGVAGAVGDWDQPTRASDERGHLSACGVVVGPICAGVFDGVGQPAGLRSATVATLPWLPAWPATNLRGRERQAVGGPARSPSRH